MKPRKQFDYLLTETYPGNSFFFERVILKIESTVVSVGALVVPKYNVALFLPLDE